MGDKDLAPVSDGGFASYTEAVEWITGLMNHGIKPGLKRMERLMELLGNPERRLKFIHVAGTNGKGSTCAFLTSVLLRNGYDVGTFTSPYIEKYTDRIRYNNGNIPEEDLLLLVNRVKPMAEQVAQDPELGSVTMFEVSTALALLYYGTVVYPDFVVWETGLGGRLDSTNIVTPLVSVITNVGHDHMDILGDTLEQVAAEKAGIIKPGVPVVTACSQPEVLAVLEGISRERKATLYCLGRDFRLESVSGELNRQSFHFENAFRRYENLVIGLNGPHQQVNAAVSLMTLEVLRQYYALVLEEEDLRAGFADARWPGRLELVKSNPSIVLDGAHNPEGAETLAAALQSGAYKRRKLHFMMGMLSTKNHTGYLSHILPIVDTLILTEPDFHKKLEAEKLAQLVEPMIPREGGKPRVIVEPNWKKALTTLQEITESEDLAVVSGTLYLISDVRAWILYESDSEKGW